MFKFVGLITLSRVLLGILLFLVTFILSLAIVSFVLVKIPADYFKKDNPRDFLADRHPAIRFLAILGKNVLGVLLVVLGVLMSLPGVPGQGILTILLGIMLLDIPGKRALEHWLVSKRRVHQAINNLRHRFGKPSLVLE